MSKISVIIPVYNSDKTISKCINSVITQSYDDSIEIIVINDGSNDNSKQIIEELIITNKTNRSIILINKPNGGVSSARNEGLKIANGEFISLLDSDDEWLTNKIQKQFDVFKNDPSIYFVGGLLKKPKKKEDYIININLNKLIFKNYFQPSTVMFKREILNQVGLFNESQRYAEEGNYFYRIAHRYKCVLINSQLVLYGQGKYGFGESGLSANIYEMEKGELKNIAFAYKHKYISVYIFILALGFSLAKYIRRVILVKSRKYVKKIWPIWNF